MRNSLVLSAFSLVIAFAVIAAAVIAFVPRASAANGNDSNSGLSVRIGNDGSVLVRGATLTEWNATSTATTTDGTFTAETSWGDTVIAWTVLLDEDTDFYDEDGDGMATSSLAVGDDVSFSGMIDEDGGAFAVDADVVKNWSFDGDDDGTADHADALMALQDADEAIDDAQDAIDDAKQDGRDVNEAEDLLDEARDHYALAQESYDDEEWDDTVEHAENAQAAAEDAYEAATDDDNGNDDDSLPERISDRIQNIIDRINDRLGEFRN